MNRIVEKAESLTVYKRLADEKADAGDFAGALGLYLTVLKARKTLSAIADVADCYADMGLLELSNYYWFLYLTVAPKDKESVAYEELAVNYFYMDNLWASSYYFRLKVERDGFIAEEGLDEEILNFFTSSDGLRDFYYIAYPYDKADYSNIAKIAKRAFSAGDISRAIHAYRKIPAECRTEEISGDFATALFLEKNDDEAIEVCKDSLARHGDNVNAYCNLSSVYSARGDVDKAEYYYSRALDARKGADSENYKIAACAIERGDDLTAKNSISRILKERPYDDVMTFFYALACVNLGDFEAGKKMMESARRISPEDEIYGYYSELVNEIYENNSLADGFLPFKYAKTLPKSVESEIKREISKVMSGKADKSFSSDLKFRKDLRYALKFEEVNTAKNAAYLLGVSDRAEDKEGVNSALIDGEVHDDVKCALVYLLIVGGEKRRINVVLSDCFYSLKPKKVVFEKKNDAGLYMSAYALALVKTLRWETVDSAKIAFNMNLLYTEYAETVRFNGFQAEDLAALSFLLCGQQKPENVKRVCSDFGVDKQKVELVGGFYDFIQKTKLIKIKSRAEKSAKKGENLD
ncbi:MAG: tetratricopeptide repeat protein [Clostridia bacterium]|nr:tetratricopeptide repeat protein [Clostridia bacterium]